MANLRTRPSCRQSDGSKLSSEKSPWWAAMAIRPGNPSTASSPPKSELSDVGVARTRVRITRMGVPFAEIPHLVHRLPGDVVDGLGQADNAAFEPCRTAET